MMYGNMSKSGRPSKISDFTTKNLKMLVNTQFALNNKLKSYYNVIDSLNYGNQTIIIPSVIKDHIVFWNENWLAVNKNNFYFNFLQ